MLIINTIIWIQSFNYIAWCKCFGLSLPYQKKLIYDRQSVLIVKLGHVCMIYSSNYSTQVKCGWPTVDKNIRPVVLNSTQNICHPCCLPNVGDTCSNVRHYHLHKTEMLPLFSEIKTHRTEKCLETLECIVFSWWMY